MMDATEAPPRDRRGWWVDNGVVIVLAVAAAAGGFALVNALPRATPVISKPEPVIPTPAPFAALPYTPDMPVEPVVYAPDALAGTAEPAPPKKQKLKPPVKVKPLPPLPAGVTPLPGPGTSVLPPAGGLGGRVPPMDPGLSMPDAVVPVSAASRVRQESAAFDGRIVADARTGTGRRLSVQVPRGKATGLVRRLREVVGPGGSVSEPAGLEKLEDAVKDLQDDLRRLRREREEGLKTFFEDAQPIQELDAKIKVIADEIDKRRRSMRDVPVTLTVVVRA